MPKHSPATVVPIAPTAEPDTTQQDLIEMQAADLADIMFMLQHVFSHVGPGDDTSMQLTELAPGLAAICSDMSDKIAFIRAHIAGGAR